MLLMKSIIEPYDCHAEIRHFYYSMMSLNFEMLSIANFSIRIVSTNSIVNKICNQFLWLLR